MIECRSRRVGIGLAGLLAAGAFGRASPGDSPLRPLGPPIVVSINGAYDPRKPAESALLLKFAREHPQLELRKWGGIALPGGGGRASLLMSIAGGSAPDIYYSWFHIIRQDIKQGFLYPLNEWVGADRDGNGQLDDKEAAWAGWRDVPPLWRQVATEEGNVYGIPFAGTVHYGLVYRKDLVRGAGLDPESPPLTWETFWRWCQKLTIPDKRIEGAKFQKGQRAFALPAYCWGWLPWVQSAGGSPLVQRRTSRATGREYEFPMHATRFVAPDTGEDLTRAPTRWLAAFDSPEGMAACAFYQKLMWAPWLRDPVTGEPLDLSPEDVARKRVMVDERAIDFTEADIIRGVARSVVGDDSEFGGMFHRGEVVVLFSGANAMEDIARTLAGATGVTGIMPIPARDAACKPVVQGFKHYCVMSEGVARRPKADRDMIWQCLQVLTSTEARDQAIRRQALTGGAMWCDPRDLLRLGLNDYVSEISPNAKAFYDGITSGAYDVRTEPFAGAWMSAGEVLDRRVISMLLAPTGKDFDYRDELKKVTYDANTGLMFELPKEELDKRRPLARVLFGIGLIVLLVCVALIVLERRAAAGKTGTSGVKAPILIPAALMAPALLSIAVWSYYPLLKGVLMAFQNYRLVGESTWVGLDNFIAVATDPNFWLYLRRTFKFVAITMGIGFVVPVMLALLLTEIPRGKIFFRTLFFLPQMSSGIVIALMWKLMYDPTAGGILNQMMRAVGLKPQAWLQDPFWAMACCILPGVWAGAGMSSLIYIAALGSFPADYYEAAAIDGAGFWKRLRHIALPQLLPLMVINFVGAFIGAFQGMGSIFLLTFGGPGNETMVLSLAIWQEAYSNLRFSTATTMGWFLGIGLIGVTYLQIRFLRRVEFRKAEGN